MRYPFAPEGIYKPALAVLCFCTLIGILAAGLWPFNPFPQNGVHWLTNPSGLHFGPEGIVVSSSLFPQAASASTPSCSFEVWLRPGENHLSNDILTFYSPEPLQALRLFQWADSTLLLYQDTRSQHREIDVDNALYPGSLLLITIAGGPNGTSVYLNGLLAAESRDLTLSMVDCSGQLVLGTSPVSDDAWVGEIRGIAVYQTEITAAQARRHFTAWTDDGQPTMEVNEAPVALYTFREGNGTIVHNQAGSSPDLYIPRSFTIPDKYRLLLPWKDVRWNRNSLKDAIVNVAGFVPLGCFFCAYLSLKSRRPALLTALGGIALSFVIELLQVYLPRRTSSLADIMMNGLGVALGILIYKSKLSDAWFVKRQDRAC